MHVGTIGDRTKLYLVKMLPFTYAGHRISSRLQYLEMAHAFKKHVVRVTGAMNPHEEEDEMVVKFQRYKSMRRADLSADDEAEWTFIRTQVGCCLSGSRLRSY